MRSGAKQKRCRILVRRKGSIKTFSSSPCFLLSFVDYILVSECVSLLSHPATQIAIQSAHPRPTLSEWWLAPPGGGTGEQRLLCQEVDRMRDPLQTAQGLTAHTQTCSLASLLTAICSQNVGTSPSSNLVLKRTHQPPFRVSTCPCGP